MNAIIRYLKHGRKQLVAVYISKNLHTGKIIKKTEIWK
jgi:hypothetical protein